jgi:hypothetical protein
LIRLSDDAYIDLSEVRKDSQSYLHFIENLEERTINFSQEKCSFVKSLPCSIIKYSSRSSLTLSVKSLFILYDSFVNHITSTPLAGEELTAEEIEEDHNININIRSPLFDRVRSHKHFASFVDDASVGLSYLPKLPEGISLIDSPTDVKSRLFLIHVMAPLVLSNSLPLPILAEIVAPSLSSHASSLRNFSDKYYNENSEGSNSKIQSNNKFLSNAIILGRDQWLLNENYENKIFREDENELKLRVFNKILNGEEIPHRLLTSFHKNSQTDSSPSFKFLFKAGKCYNIMCPMNQSDLEVSSFLLPLIPGDSVPLYHIPVINNPVAMRCCFSDVYRVKGIIDSKLELFHSPHLKSFKGSYDRSENIDLYDYDSQALIESVKAMNKSVSKSDLDDDDFSEWIIKNNKILMRMYGRDKEIKLKCENSNIEGETNKNIESNKSDIILLYGATNFWSDQFIIHEHPNMSPPLNAQFFDNILNLIIIIIFFFLNLYFFL